MERSIRRPCIASTNILTVRSNDEPDVSTRHCSGENGAVLSGYARYELPLVECFITGRSLGLRLGNGSRMMRECHVRF